MSANKQQGLYLLDDGLNQFLWIGRDAVPALLLDVFGVEDQQQIRQGTSPNQTHYP